MALASRRKEDDADADEDEHEDEEGDGNAIDDVPEGRSAATIPSTGDKKEF